MRPLETSLLLLAAVAGAMVRPARAAEEGKAPPGFLAFHAVARDAGASPPDVKRLAVLCQEKLAGPKGYENAWISFLGTEPRRVLLVAFTRDRMASPAEVITLRPRFAPLPTARFSRSATLDWGYVYDRDGDGRVDYLAYLQNAHAVLPDPLPPGFPVARPDAEGRVSLTKELAHAMIDAAQMVFRHYADDDGDGRIDAMVVEEFDPDRPMFVKDWIAYRAARPGGEPEEAWVFRGDVRERRRTLERGPDGFALPPAVPGDVPVPLRDVVANASERLGVIAAALERCRRDAGPLVLPGR